MRNGAAVVILAVTGSILAADTPSKETVPREVESVQGTWVAISGEADGRKADDAEIQGFKMVVNGHQLTFNPGTSKRESVFQLDPTKTPKQIIVTPLDGPAKGKPAHGIYVMQNGRLTLCISNDPRHSEPPAGFATRPGDGLRLLVLKREAPDTGNAK